MPIGCNTADVGHENNEHARGRTMATFKVKGINDDCDDCECCGKTGLKRVVWIENVETGDIQHFGTSCATNPAKAFNLKREIAKAVRDFDTAAKAEKQAQRNAAITAACKLACETFTGAMRQGRFNPIPVDGDAFQAWKMNHINAALAEL